MTPADELAAIRAANRAAADERQRLALLVRQRDPLALARWAEIGEEQAARTARRRELESLGVEENRAARRTLVMRLAARLLEFDDATNDLDAALGDEVDDPVADAMDGIYDAFERLDAEIPNWRGLADVDPTARSKP